jgi:hypothetical protein
MIALILRKNPLGLRMISTNTPKKKEIAKKLFAITAVIIYLPFRLWKNGKLPAPLCLFSIFAALCQKKSRLISWKRS